MTVAKWKKAMKRRGTAAAARCPGETSKRCHTHHGQHVLVDITNVLMVMVILMIIMTVTIMMIIIKMMTMMMVLINILINSTIDHMVMIMLVVIIIVVVIVSVVVVSIIICSIIITSSSTMPRTDTPAPVCATRFRYGMLCEHSYNF